MSNPYDRNLLLPQSTKERESTINLLDLVSIDETSFEGKVQMRRRQQLSPSGQGLLFQTGGEVQKFAKDLIIGASKVGATFYLDQVIAENEKAFERFEELQHLC